MKLVLLFTACMLGLGMAFTQHYALLHSWYWTYPWLDSVMHFSGGVVITLIALAYLGTQFRVLAVTLVVGVLWEIYEYAIGISLTEPNFALDTTIDLTMDLLGALVAWGIIHTWQRYALPSTAARGESPDQTSSLP